MPNDGIQGGTPEHQTPDWRAWMQDLGRKVRQTREAMGLSQSELAAAAGVSQGAISRLETGRGLATPLLVVLKTALALLDAGRRVGREAPAPGAALVFESAAQHVSPDGRFSEAAASIDPRTLELLATYRALPADAQRRILDAARHAAAAAPCARNGDRPTAAASRENLG